MCFLQPALNSNSISPKLYGPFSLVYQAALFGGNNNKVSIDLSNKNNYNWLLQLIKVWDFLKLNHINVKENVMTCLSINYIDNVKYLLHNDKNNKINEREAKKMKLQRDLHEKSVFYYYALRPFINFVLAIDEKCEEDDENFNKSNYQKLCKMIEEEEEEAAATAQISSKEMLDNIINKITRMNIVKKKHFM